MDISAYTSNVQSYGEPYGSSGGTKLALDDGDAISNAVSVEKSIERKDESEKLDAAQKAEAVKELTQNRIELNKEQLEKMVEQMDHFVNSINKGLSFRVDDESGRDVVTIYEASTGDIIRQIPDEEMLIILRRLAVASSGLFIEETV